MYHTVAKHLKQCRENPNHRCHCIFSAASPALYCFSRARDMVWWSDLYPLEADWDSPAKTKPEGVLWSLLPHTHIYLQHWHVTTYKLLPHQLLLGDDSYFQGGWSILTPAGGGLATLIFIFDPSLAVLLGTCQTSNSVAVCGLANAISQR